jgi:heavy metal efflux system protein
MHPPNLPRIRPKSVPNVVDVSEFRRYGAREYQVRVDPNKLVSYGLSISQVEQQPAHNHINAGGSFVEVGMQQINVHALGLAKQPTTLCLVFHPCSVD